MVFLIDISNTYECVLVSFIIYFVRIDLFPIVWFYCFKIEATPFSLPMICFFFCCTSRNSLWKRSLIWTESEIYKNNRSVILNRNDIDLICIDWCFFEYCFHVNIFLSIFFSFHGQIWNEVLLFCSNCNEFEPLLKAQEFLKLIDLQNIRIQVVNTHRIYLTVQLTHQIAMIVAFICVCDFECDCIWYTDSTSLFTVKYINWLSIVATSYHFFIRTSVQSVEFPISLPFSCTVQHHKSTLMTDNKVIQCVYFLEIIHDVII